MAKTEHTPGPWSVQNVGNVYTSTGPVVNAGKKRIAKLTGIAEVDYANAHLIAAAPDLLDDIQYIAFAAGTLNDADLATLEDGALLELTIITAKALRDIKRHIANAIGQEVEP